MTLVLTGRTIGENIKLARMKANISQERLGKELLVSGQMIDKYENGAPIGEMKLEKIAEVCGVSVEELTDTSDGGAIVQAGNA